MSQCLMIKRARAKSTAVSTRDSAEMSPIAEANRINGKTLESCLQALSEAEKESEKLRDAFLKKVSEYQQQANAIRDLMYKNSPTWELRQSMTAEHKTDFAAIEAKVRMNLDLRKLAESVW